jgi:hypothetical protein
MVGGPGLRVCPGTFKTTIILIIIRDSSVHTFLLFINFSALLFVFSCRQRVLAFSISVQITGRADHLPWGITLPWIMGATALRKRIQRKMCFIASPEFVSSGRGGSKHAAHPAHNHQFGVFHAVNHPVSYAFTASSTARFSGIRALQPRNVRLFAAAGGAGFLDRFFDRFAGFARALLNPANQFFLLAFGVLEIVIRELGPFLFQFALGDVPVAFDFECGHNSL